MPSPAFRKIIEDSTGMSLERVQATPLAEMWARREAELKEKLGPAGYAKLKKERDEAVRRIAWRY